MNFGTLPKLWHETETTDKKALREKIQRDVDLFLYEGGEVEDCGGIEERPDYARPVYIHDEGQA